MSKTSVSPASRVAGVAGRLGGTLFFGVFLLMGLFFLLMLGREVLRSAETFFWPKSPAVILSSGVADESGREEPYVVQVRYRFTWNGVEHESDQVRRSQVACSDYAAAAQVAASYPAGSATECFVHPNGTEAVLQHGGLWMALFLLIPLVFVAVGAGGIYASWTRGRKTISRPVTARSNAGTFTRWFGLLFVAVGLAVLVFWYLPTLAQSLASLGWVETPCTIVSSRVVEVDSDDGTTYRVDIRYRYVFEQKEYQSNRYKSFGGSSSGRAAKEKIVDRFPPGSTAVCYVDASAPHQAVLVRGVGWEAAFGFLPLAFIGVGLAVALSGGGQRRPVVAADDEAGESRELRSRISPAGRLLGVLFGMFFWNGIVSVFVFHVVGEWQNGQQPWGLTLFLIPFVLVGAALVFAVVYALMALTNPRVTLVVTPGVLRAGREFEVTWKLSGSASRLTHLRITLEGREEATYQRGTSSYTDRHVFARLAVAEAGTVLEMVEGTARRRLPEGLPPGFASSNNKILWTLRVHGAIPRWPDVHEEFDIALLGEEK